MDCFYCIKSKKIRGFFVKVVCFLSLIQGDGGIYPSDLIPGKRKNHDDNHTHTIRRATIVQPNGMIDEKLRNLMSAQVLFPDQRFDNRANIDVIGLVFP